MVISLQSLSPTVLELVKRSNINIDVFTDIMKQINEAGGISSTEIILGLPGETYDSHKKTLKQLFDMNISDIICYNGLVLEGTEMARQREKYGLKTKFRLTDGCWGIYAGEYCFDAEEGIMSHNMMSNSELLSFRKVHWLIWLMWNYRFYYDYLKFLQFYDINPLDFIYELIQHLYVSSGKANEVIQSFDADTQLEWHNNYIELYKFYSNADNFKKLQSGVYGGKLNSKYMWSILLDAQEDFKNIVLETGLSLCKQKEILTDADMHHDILLFNEALTIDFRNDPETLGAERTETMNYDIIKWRKDGYAFPLSDYKRDFNVKFYLSEKKLTSLQTLLRQYLHPVKKVMYRKMCEFMNIEDLQLDIEIL